MFALVNRGVINFTIERRKNVVEFAMLAEFFPFRHDNLNNRG